MRLALLIALGVAFAGCRGEDPVNYGGPDRIWTLQQLNNMPFAAPATLTFPTPQEINGEGPCNHYFGAVNDSYPDFNAGPIGSTRRACPELAAESLFFEALQAVNLASVDGTTLILTGPDGLKMVFTADG